MAEDLPIHLRGQLYHLVVRGNELVMPVLYMPRIQRVLNGIPEVTANGQMILSMNMEYAITSYQTKVQKFQSVQATRGTLDSDVIVACDALKRFLNTNPCMLWFHREEKDSGCTEGNHLHIIYWNRGKTTAIFRLTSYRNLRTKIHAVEGQKIFQQKVKTTGMFIYLNSGNAVAKMTQTENSRIFMGSTSIELLQFNAAYHPSKMKQAYLQWKACWVTEIYESARDDATDVTEDGLFEVFGIKPPVKAIIKGDGTLVKGRTYSNIQTDKISLITPQEITTGMKRSLESNEAAGSSTDEVMALAISGTIMTKKPKANECRIEKLVGLFVKYSTQKFPILLEKLEADKNQIAYNFCKEVQAHSNFSMILNSALAEYHLVMGERLADPADILYDESGWQPHKWYLGVFETLLLFENWMHEQRHNMFEFCADFYAILMKMFVKRNCLLIKGVACDGRQYWVECILKPIRDYVALIDQTSKFPFGNMRKKVVAVARCDEFEAISMDMIDDFKLITGGQTFTANVRNGSPVQIKRTPVVVTTRRDLWQFSPGNKEPILNRCLIHEFREPTCVVNLSKEEKYPNSLLFKQMFQFFSKQGLTAVEENGDISYIFKKNDQLSKKNCMKEFAVWLYEEMINEKCLSQKEEDNYWKFMEN